MNSFLDLIADEAYASNLHEIFRGSLAKRKLGLYLCYSVGKYRGSSMNIMTKLVVLGGIALLGGTAGATTVEINFDDLDTSTDPVLVINQYAALGVTFQNAEAVDPATNSYPYFDGQSIPNVVADPESSGFIDPSDPIIASFAMDVYSVSVMGLDVGEAGFLLQAFDAMHNLLGSQHVIGNGLGVGAYYTLTIDATGIRSVEFSQYYSSSNDGMVFDNFQYSYNAPVPEPTLSLLLGAGIAGWGAYRKKKLS